MLTDAAIKCMKSKPTSYKVTDRDGMYLVVSPSGALTFRYDYRLNGRRVRSGATALPAFHWHARGRSASTRDGRLPRAVRQLKKSSATSAA